MTIPQLVAVLRADDLKPRRRPIALVAAEGGVFIAGHRVLADRERADRWRGEIKRALGV